MGLERAPAGRDIFPQLTQGRRREEALLASFISTRKRLLELGGDPPRPLLRTACRALVSAGIWSCQSALFLHGPKMEPGRTRQGHTAVGHSFMGLHGLAASEWAFMFRHATVSL